MRRVRQEEFYAKFPDRERFQFVSIVDAFHYYCYYGAEEIKLAQEQEVVCRAYPPGSGMEVLTLREELLGILCMVPLEIELTTASDGFAGRPMIFFYRFPNARNPKIVSFAIRVVPELGTRIVKITAPGKFPRISGDNPFEMDQEKGILSLVFENLVRLEVAFSVESGEELLRSDPTPPRAAAPVSEIRDRDCL